MSKDKPVGISVFSLEQVELMLHVLDPFDAFLNQVDSSFPNVTFAKNTVILLRGKLQEMLQEKNYTKLFGLDTNEIVIVHTSLQLFSYGLTEIENSVGKERMRNDCNALVSYFASMLAEKR